ncbi:MAG: nitrite reductase large subunit NirB [Gammaproteobacteria bacterium]|jgi:nitrite reductase (NADH) large subunit|nr:nitrite reductase large subunit NirB [Gammaproteobacteria bacterium]
MRQKLVLIGNGMAGMRTVEELLKQDSDLYEITVFGDEPHGNYNRILLSPLLSGEKSLDDIMLNRTEWYAQNGITLNTGKRIESIDRKRRVVIASDGAETPYDRLILATGSRPFVIPIPGKDLPGVISFRDIHDVEAMLESSRTGKHAVVIGGGLLGLEAANGLMKQGMDVTVVHLLDTLMERQLDKPAATLLKASLEARGLRFLMQARTEAFVGEDRVTAVRFEDGHEVPADLVVMAVGIRPNTELATRAGLYCERGVVVDDTLQTYDPRIYAVGECVQHRGETYGLVAPLFEQARVCANHLAQYGIARYEGSVTSTKLKVTGIDLFSAGDFSGGDGAEEIVMQDAAGGVYKKLVLRDNRIEGAVLYGDTVEGAWYFQLMREETDISDFRDRILFGRHHLGDSGHGGQNQAVLMANDAQVCDCNGVCKGDIVNAITQKGLFTLDDVKTHTKASASCGSCTGLVEQILASTLGGDYESPEHKPMCKCIDLTHDQVRAAIRDQHLKSVRSAMDFMEWKTPDGCAACRPALNYYLISTWPEEAADEYQSRFINERAHANIQKDGTYSVVPRIFGGETSPAQLRALAEVAEKYDVPTVKITGGQRIDMLGLRKEQLPGIWGDLAAAGFVSGHAYGKAMRTVKTCVGSQWCRFGVQDSTRMGIELEKLTWGSWTPHKFKLAVSGCPRNCAEATIKDFGVVAIDSGWELHVGGNGGVKVRATDLLCRVETETEVLEYCGAFMQVYREEARYLERTAPWVERVGLSYVKQRVVEDEIGRKALFRRFLDSQEIYQFDPWEQRARGVDEHEFTVMRQVGG